VCAVSRSNQPDLGFSPVLKVRKNNQSRDDAYREGDGTRGFRLRPQKAIISPCLTVEPNIHLNSADRHNVWSDDRRQAS
jgi:hypothetical protein